MNKLALVALVALFTGLSLDVQALFGRRAARADAYGVGYGRGYRTYGGGYGRVVDGTYSADCGCAANDCCEDECNSCGSCC